MSYKATTIRSNSAALFVVCGALFVLAGCGHGNGQGLDSGGNLITADNDAAQSSGGDTGGDSGGDTGNSAGASGNPNARLDWVQTNVFGGVCSQCHTGGAILGLDWDSEASTCSNVGQDSAENNTLKEIDSGNPDLSYLIWKVQGAGPGGEPIIGEQMPAGGNPALSAETIQNMRDWIADGTPGCTAPRPSGDESSSDVSSFDQSASSDMDYTPGSWKDVWNESLRVCTLCHSTSPSSPECSIDIECPPQGVVLTVDNYSGVVEGNIVMPYDLEGSSLWQRVTAANHDMSMPQGLVALKQDQLDAIQHWIEDGAPFCPQNQACE